MNRRVLQFLVLGRAADAVSRVPDVDIMLWHPIVSGERMRAQREVCQWWALL